jgi:hypothetical protein
VKPPCILGVHYGNIKLYPTGKGLFDTGETEHAYLDLRDCDNIQTKDEEEDAIVDRTIQN